MPLTVAPPLRAARTPSWFQLAKRRSRLCASGRTRPTIGQTAPDPGCNSLLLHLSLQRYMACKLPFVASITGWPDAFRPPSLQLRPANRDTSPMSFVTDLKFAFRSFTRAKGLALTVIVTLALGIGANAAMFSVVRGVLLRPLVNRDESRLIYIRQSAPGIAVENMTFSVPELIDLRSRLKTVTELGDFSTTSFTMVGLGEPRVVRSGVVGGSFFNVMGLRPLRGRLIDATDDVPNAAPVAVLTHRFWTTALGSDPDVVGKTVRLGGGALSDDHRHPRAIGALSDRNRDHRERRHEPAPPVGHDGDGPHASDDGAVRPPGARRGSRGGAHRAAHRVRGHRPASSPRRIRRSPTSGSTRSCCGIRSRRRRERCFSFCWPRRR